MAIMGRYRAEWGNGGRLWGAFQPFCVFNGLVDGFAEILVLFRAHDDRPSGGFQVQEVHEVAARQVLELVVVAHLVDEQAQGEVNGVLSSERYLFVSERREEEKSRSCPGFSFTRQAASLTRRFVSLKS